MTIEHPELHQALKGLVDLNEQKSAFLDDQVATNPVDHYVSADWFAR